MDANLLTGKVAALNSENVIIENIIGVNGDKVYYDSGKDIYKMYYEVGN